MDVQPTDTNPIPPSAAEAVAPPASPAAAAAPAAPASPLPPSILLALPPKSADNGGRGMIIGLAACWVAAGLFVAPLETLSWLLCVGVIGGLAWWISSRMDNRVYERLAHCQCAQCGFDLQSSGNSGDCPRCGAWFGPGWGAALPKELREGVAEGQAQNSNPPPEEITSSPQIATVPADERKCA